MTRPYCRCTVVQNYDYDQAAEKLRCKPRFLRDRISSLPHQKLGDSVAFCDCELALIQQMFTVTPASAGAVVSHPALAGAASSEPKRLASITPSRGRRRQPAVL